MVVQEAERYWLERWDNPPEAQSRMSRNLQGFLAEHSCICYFVLHLKTKDALTLVKFWLDMESFKAAASAGNALIDGGPGLAVWERRRWASWTAKKCILGWVRQFILPERGLRFHFHILGERF